MRQLSIKHLIVNNRLVHCHNYATKTPFSCSSSNPSSLILLVPLLPQWLSQALSPTFCCIGYVGCIWYGRGNFSHTSFRTAFNCDNLHSKHIVLAHSQFGQYQITVLRPRCSFLSLAKKLSTNFSKPQKKPFYSQKPSPVKEIQSWHQNNNQPTNQTLFEETKKLRWLWCHNISIELAGVHKSSQPLQPCINWCEVEGDCYNLNPKSIVVILALQIG